MGANRVKGIVIEIGGNTTGLNKALSDSNKQIGTTKSNLKDVERLLKLDPTNTTLLEQKQRLLADAISETEDKLQTLNTANDQVKDSVKNYDAWKAAYVPIQEEIDTTKKKLKDLEDQQKKMQDAGDVDTDAYKQLTAEIKTTSGHLKDLQEQAKKVSDEFGNPISQEQYDSLQREIIETENSLRDLTAAAQDTQKKLGVINGDSFDKVAAALEDASKKCDTLKGDLDSVDKALEMDPGNIPLLTEKWNILNESIEETKKKLELLEEQQDDVSAKYAAGDIDRGAYLEFRTEIAKTRKELKDLEDGAEKNFQEIADATDPAKKEIREIGDTVEDVEDKAADFGDILKADLIVEGAGRIIDSIKEIAEETKEYRKMMGSLEVSSESNGYTEDQTAEAYKRLYGVLGDDQSSATALANLQALGLEQEQLMKVIDYSIGGWAKYGDSIPIDSLAEAINETIKTGQVTGTFADILNWGAQEGNTYGAQITDCASAEDYFNQALQNCSTEAERVNLVTQALADQGLSEMAEKWRENNASMVESNEASANLQEQMAILGETVEPLATRLTELCTEALSWFNSLDTGTQDFVIATVGIIAALGPVGVAVSGVSKVVNLLSGTDIPDLSSAFGTITGTVLPGLKTAFTTTFSFIASNPVVLLIGAIVGLVATVAAKGDEIQAKLNEVDDYVQGVFEKDWTQTFGPVLGGVMNNFMSDLKNYWDSGMEILNGIIDFIRGVFTGDWERAWDGVKGIFKGALDGILALAGTNIDELKEKFSTGLNKIKDFFAGIKWELPKIKMPHFTITGNFSLNPPSAPKFSVEWYAKGGILDGAQIFGMLGNTFLGGGEAGKEAVLPLDSFYANLRTILSQILDSPENESVLAHDSFSSLRDLLSQFPTNSDTSNSVRVNVNIEHFENNTDSDIDELAEELSEIIAFKTQQKEAALT